MRPAGIKTMPTERDTPTDFTRASELTDDGTGLPNRCRQCDHPIADLDAGEQLADVRLRSATHGALCVGCAAAQGERA